MVGKCAATPNTILMTEEDGQFLQRETIKEMLRLQYPKSGATVGLGWEVDEQRRLAGHDGADPGVSTLTAISVEDQYGVVILTNGRDDFRQMIGFWALSNNLYRLVKKYIEEESIPEQVFRKFRFRAMTKTPRLAEQSLELFSRLRRHSFLYQRLAHPTVRIYRYCWPWHEENIPERISPEKFESCCSKKDAICHSLPAFPSPHGCLV